MSTPGTLEGAGPLVGITVLDLTQHLAGPFATQILGDLGARIIKIEPPTGDPTRHIGPHFVDGDSAYYMSVNRNKESVCLDLKSEHGRKALLALAVKVDAVVENFRPGTLDRLGIGFDVMVEANPRLVTCSISGFGQDGPYRDRPAFDMVVQALSGGMSLTGEIDGRPVRSGLPIGDLCAGANAAIAILAGLFRSATQNEGASIDVSMLDTQVSLLSYVAAYFLTSGTVPGPQGRQHMSIPTYRALTCRDDRDIVITANVPRMWAGLCRALEVEHLIDDPRFSSNEHRRAYSSDLAVELESAALRFTADELLARLSEEGVPNAPINSVDAALDDPQVLSRNMVIRTKRGEDVYAAVGNPINISHGRSSFTAPPRLGEHTEAVLGSLRDDGHIELDALAASGAAGVFSSITAVPQGD